MINDNDIYTLYVLFGNTMHKAFEIIDSNEIECMVCTNSKLYYYNVYGSDIYPYTTTQYYCTCPAYINSVILGGTLYCKHQLACMLAYALNKCKIQYINDDMYVLNMLNDRNKEFKQRQTTQL